MNLVKNMVLEYCTDNEERTIERILWTGRDMLLVATIRLDVKDALPTMQKIEEIEAAFLEGHVRLLKEDPYAAIVDESKITEKDIEHRNRVWNLIKPIATDEPNIYIRESRGKLIRELEASSNVSKKTIYKYLYRYWMGGKVLNALLPQSNKSGGKGKPKTVGDKLIGRPKKYSNVSRMNINDSTKEIFHKAITRYYSNIPGAKLKRAYEDMLREFYTVQSKDSDGFPTVELLPEEKRPTFIQFRYWYKKAFNVEEQIVQQKGQRRFNLDHRAILNTSRMDVFGPGSVYQIDSTPANIHLVSRLNRNRIIGRPILYLVVDVFSNLIVGFYVGPESASWMGHAMALYNAFTDKTELCHLYNMNVTEAEWPASYIPVSIYADRGEGISRHSVVLTSTLDIRTENAPPSRADLKGIVERLFGIMDNEYFSRIPGHIEEDHLIRGGPDYRTKASLDIYEFTQIVIHAILNYNESKLLNFDVLDKEMVAAGVLPIPNELWKWGAVHRAGLLRTRSEDQIKMALMPSDRATVTAKGLKYKKRHYSSPFAMENRWFESARTKGTWKVDIAYDPRCMNTIYYKFENGRSFIPFEMVAKDKYGDLTLEEIEDINYHESVIRKKLEEVGVQKKIKTNESIDRIIKNGVEETRIERDTTLSTSRRVKNIRENQKNERERIRSTEFFEIGQGTEKTDEKPKSKQTNTPSDPEIEILRKIQRERIHGK